MRDRNKLSSICLVQRIKRVTEPPPRAIGIDRDFQFDYMGSAEFEFSTIPDALKLSRARVSSKWAPSKIRVKDHVAFYVGPPELKHLAQMFFEIEMAQKYPKEYRTKEPTYLFDTYADTASYSKADGWWILDFDPPIALFVKKADADQWFLHLRQPPAKKQGG